MNEEERAAWLARAVDNLIQRRAAEPPKELNDRDLEGLLRAARARLELAETTAHAGLQYEGAVWRKILDRLERRAAAATPAPGSPTFFLRRAGDEAKDPDPGEQELHELEEVAGLRKSMSAELMAFAEGHRDAVWDRIQSRLAARVEKKGFFSFLSRDRKDAEKFSGALEGLTVGQTVWQSGDSRMDELIGLARKRRVLGQMAQVASADTKKGEWWRLPRPAPSHGAASPRPAYEGRRAGWQRFAAGAAALTLIVAALGPVPATGLAGHPLIGFVQDLGEHVGVTESGPPPAEGRPPVVVEGTTVTAAEASALIGVTVSETAVVPAGFTPAASLYYASGMTSTGGAFLLTYTSANGALLVLQEASTESGLGVEAGTATDITLSDGTPATYVDGTWTPGGAGFTWDAGSGRTLVFDRNGVRTIIQFVGDPAGAPDLEAIAAGLS